MQRESMRKAKQNRASLVSKAEPAEQVMLERRDVSLTEVAPLGGEAVEGAREERLRALRQRLMAGIPLGGKAPSKAEMHGFD